MWHAPDAELDDYVQRLVTFAAVHRDAHLAKYTLACLDATRDDPGAGRLYLAAAATSPAGGSSAAATTSCS